MKVLLDTHILLWAISGSKKLPKEAREILLDPDNTIYYSSISVWEVALKHRTHPKEMELSGKAFAAYCKEAGYLRLDMNEEHVLAEETLKVAEGAAPHNDPFDRMLIAQAKAEKLILITKDVKMQSYHESCIRWVSF